MPIEPGGSLKQREVPTARDVLSWLSTAVSYGRMWRSHLHLPYFGITIWSPPELLAVQAHKHEVQMRRDWHSPVIILNISSEPSIEAVDRRFGPEGSVRDGQKLLAKTSSRSSILGVFQPAEGGAKYLIAAAEVTGGLVLEGRTDTRAQDAGDEAVAEAQSLLDVVTSARPTDQTGAGYGRVRQVLFDSVAGAGFALPAGSFLHSFEDEEAKLARQPGVVTNMVFSAVPSPDADACRGVLERCAADNPLRNARVEQVEDGLLLTAELFTSYGVEYELRCACIQGAYGWRLQVATCCTVYDERGRREQDRVIRSMAKSAELAPPQPGDAESPERGLEMLERFKAFRYRRPFS